LLHREGPSANDDPKGLHVSVQRWRVLAIVPLLSLVALAGACSPKVDANKPFCDALRDSPELFSQLDTSGEIDVVAFRTGLADLKRLAPPAIHDQVVFLAGAMSAYFDVGDRSMTLAEFNRKFTQVHIERDKHVVDAWTRSKCGFGLP
jgi:hypothetical protein